MVFKALLLDNVGVVPVINTIAESLIAAAVSTASRTFTSNPFMVDPTGILNPNLLNSKAVVVLVVATFTST